MTHLEPYNIPQYEKLFVVFIGKTDLPWLRILKPGFRHCYIMGLQQGLWFSIDPLANQIEFIIHNLPPHYRLEDWAAAHGGKAVQVNFESLQMRMMPVEMFTCVAFVKRFLRIRRRRIITPYQLYRYLEEKRVRENAV